MKDNGDWNCAVDTPALDCIWKGLLHRETPRAHPSASLRSLSRKQKYGILLLHLLQHIGLIHLTHSTLQHPFKQRSPTMLCVSTFP